MSEAPVRILITGCRDWRCHDLADAVIARLLARYGPNLTIVHGDCPTGVDAAFEEAAAAHDLPTERHPARWEDLSVPGAVVRRRRDGTQFNAYAGPQRNEAMVKLGATLCLAVHRYLMGSKGTLGCVKLALASGIPTWLISDAAGTLRRLTMEDLK